MTGATRLDSGAIQSRIDMLEGNHVMLDNPFTRAELLAVYRLAATGFKVQEALKKVKVACDPLPSPDPKRPGRRECIKDYRAMVRITGRHPTRRYFLQNSVTGRRYERLWKNFTTFIKDAKK